ncbi:unnamed protein product [Caenorhabditis brenneri]
MRGSRGGQVNRHIFCLVLLFEVTMAAMYRISLLSLPILASIEILKSMSPFEIIAVSLCSRRAKVMCKSIRSKSQCKESIIKQSYVKHCLRMWLNTKPNFFFNFSNLKTFPVELDVIPAHWIKLKHIYNLQSDSLVLGTTRLVNKDFKQLIEKWRSGWTPKWTYLLIKLDEDVDISSYLNENLVEIEDFTSRKAIIRNSSTEFFKFESSFHYKRTRIIQGGYHMIRSSDSEIATVTVVDVNRRVVWFHIQSTDVNAPLAVDIKYDRTYSALNQPPSYVKGRSRGDDPFKSEDCCRMMVLPCKFKNIIFQR